MKVISVEDLKLAAPLSRLNYIEMISPEYHHLVIPVLEEIGFDSEYPIIVEARQHRTWANKVTINYVFIGEINISRSHLKGPWASLEDLMIGVSYTDRSLHQELCQMSGTQSSYETCHAISDDENQEIINILNNYQDSSETKRIDGELKVLNDILFQVRGTQMLASGAHKLWQEYHEEEKTEKFFRNKRNKKNKDI